MTSFVTRVSAPVVQAVRNGATWVKNWVAKNPAATLVLVSLFGVVFSNTPFAWAGILFFSVLYLTGKTGVFRDWVANMLLTCLTALGKAMVGEYGKNIAITVNGAIIVALIYFKGNFSEESLMTFGILAGVLAVLLSIVWCSGKVPGFGAKPAAKKKKKKSKKVAE